MHDILFTPVSLGAVACANRIIMAPMTRDRAGPGDVPPNVERYEQPNGALAAEFAAAFNEAELKAPKGVWAVH